MIQTSYPPDTAPTDLPLQVGDEIAFVRDSISHQGVIMAIEWLDGETGWIDASIVKIDDGFYGIVLLEEVEKVSPVDYEDDKTLLDEDEGDDLCDHCMRSGVAISMTDEAGRTMCAECAQHHQA